MFRKIAAFIFSVILLGNICGCVALIAGSVAGGAGTAVWLSGKLVQNVNVPLEQAVSAAKDYLQSGNKGVTVKETISDGHAVAQIRSRYVTGDRIRVDIHKIADNRSRIEVRVGTLVSNKDAADRVLKGIVERF